VELELEPRILKKERKSELLLSLNEKEEERG